MTKVRKRGPKARTSVKKDGYYWTMLAVGLNSSHTHF